MTGRVLKSATVDDMVVALGELGVLVLQRVSGHLVKAFGLVGQAWVLTDEAAKAGSLGWDCDTTLLLWLGACRGRGGRGRPLQRAGAALGRNILGCHCRW